VTKSSAGREEGGRWGAGRGGVEEGREHGESFPRVGGRIVNVCKIWQIWLVTQKRVNLREGGGSERDHQQSLISSIFSQMPAALFYKPTELRTAKEGEERIVLVWW